MINLIRQLINVMLKKPDNYYLKKYWNNKDNKKIITYPGRSLPFSQTKCEIPVNILVTPLDPFIKNDLKNWGYYNVSEDFETLIPKIYQKIKTKYYNYEYDKNTWGNSEVWEFPFEMREKGINTGFDCDSWAVFQLSYYIAAEIPSWRTRIVVGNCSLGGHATVYIYSLKDKTWHHLNSTYGRLSSYKNIADYPTKQDAIDKKDKLGIYTPWFSFNNKYIWDNFTIGVDNYGKKENEHKL